LRARQAWERQPVKNMGLGGKTTTKPQSTLKAKARKKTLKINR